MAREVVYSHYSDEAENDYIAMWQIYWRNSIPNFVRISRDLRENILAYFLRHGVLRCFRT